VVGHGDRRLPERSRMMENFFNLISPIEEAVLSVKMEMNELRHADSREEKKLRG
jgi:hypothetical protein